MEGAHSPARSPRAGEGLLGVTGTGGAGRDGVANPGGASPRSAHESPLNQPVFGIQEKGQNPLKPREKGKRKNAHALPDTIDLEKLPHGTEGAKIAATSAITSVSWAMQQVHEESHAKQRELEILRAQKAALEEKLKESEKLCRDTQGELRTTQLSLSEFADRNEELFRTLASEQAAFHKLKEDAVKLQGRLDDLQQTNKELVDRQVSERNVRDELATELSSMQEEINSLELEKSKFQHHFAEMELKLKIEADAFEQEKASWKEKQMGFLKKLQNKEAELRAEHAAKAQLKQTLNEQEEQRKYLDHQLKALDRQLKELTHEHTETKEELKRVRDVNASLIQKNTDANNKVEVSENELKKSQEQLRVMAEKVFQLMTQLQQLDKWKATASAEQLEASRTMLMYKRKYETLAKQHDEESKKIGSLNSSVETLRDKLDKQTRISETLKLKYAASQRSAKRLETELRGQTNVLNEMAGKQTKLCQALENAKSGHEVHNREVRDLEGAVKTLRTGERQLKVQLATLQKDKDVLIRALKIRDIELSKWRKKDKLFFQLREAVGHEAGEQTLQDLEKFEANFKAELEAMPDDTEALERATSEHAAPGEDGADEDDAVSHAEEDVRDTGAHARGRSRPSRSRSVTTLRKGPGAHTNSAASANNKKTMRRAHSTPKFVAVRSNATVNSHAEGRVYRMGLRKLLRSKQGVPLMSTLGKLQIDEASLLKWNTSPDQLFEGLTALVGRVQQAKFGKSSTTAKEQEIKLLQEKNKELSDRSAETEECKTKAILRIATLLTKYAGRNITAAAGGENGGGAAGRTDVVEDSNVSLLQLSSNGIEDPEVEHLARAIKDNTIINEVDLSRNRISNDGLMALVLSTLSENCAVETLDLRHNRITLNGMELLVNFLQHSTGLGGVVGASISEERDRSMVPYITIRTTSKTIAVDLRHNPLFPKESEDFKRRREILERFGSILSSASQGKVPNIFITSDGKDGDDCEPDVPSNITAAFSHVQRAKLQQQHAQQQALSGEGGVGAAQKSNTVIMSRAGHPTVTLWSPKAHTSAHTHQNTTSANGYSHYNAATNGGNRRKSGALGSSASTGTLPNYRQPRRASNNSAVLSHTHSTASPRTLPTYNGFMHGDDARPTSQAVEGTFSTRGEKYAERTFSSGLRSASPAHTGSTPNLPSPNGARTRPKPIVIGRDARSPTRTSTSHLPAVKGAFKADD